MNILRQHSNIKYTYNDIIIFHICERKYQFLSLGNDIYSYRQFLIDKLYYVFYDYSMHKNYKQVNGIFEQILLCLSDEYTKHN